MLVATTKKRGTNNHQQQTQSHEPPKKNRNRTQTGLYAETARGLETEERSDRGNQSPLEIVHNDSLSRDYRRTLRHLSHRERPWDEVPRICLR